MPAAIHRDLLPMLLLAATTLPAQQPDYAHLRADRAATLTAPFGWFSLVALQ